MRWCSPISWFLLVLVLALVSGQTSATDLEVQDIVHHPQLCTTQKDWTTLACSPFNSISTSNDHVEYYTYRASKLSDENEQHSYYTIKIPANASYVLILTPADADARHVPYFYFSDKPFIFAHAYYNPDGVLNKVRRVTMVAHNSPTTYYLKINFNRQPFVDLDLSLFTSPFYCPNPEEVTHIQCVAKPNNSSFMMNFIQTELKIENTTDGVRLSPPEPTQVFLDKEQTVTAQKGQQLYYYLLTPRDQVYPTILNLNTSISSGDVDVYAKFGQLPTPFFFDYVDSTADNNFSLLMPVESQFIRIYILYDVIEDSTFKWTLHVQQKKPGCISDCSGPTHGKCIEDKVCMCLDGFSGVFCQVKDAPLKPLEAVSGRLGPANWNYYIASSASDSLLNIYIEFQSGQMCDLFINSNAYPSLDSYVYFVNSLTKSYNYTIEPPVSQDWFLGIFSLTNCDYTIKVDHLKSCPTECVPPYGSCHDSSQCICSPGYYGHDCRSPVLALQPNILYHGTLKTRSIYYQFQGNTDFFLVSILEVGSHSKLVLDLSLLDNFGKVHGTWSDHRADVVLHKITVSDIPPIDGLITFLITISSTSVASSKPIDFDIVCWPNPLI